MTEELIALATEDAASLIRQVSEMAERKATELAQASETDSEGDYWALVAKECAKQLNERRIAAINAREETP